MTSIDLQSKGSSKSPIAFIAASLAAKRAATSFAETSSAETSSASEKTR